MGRRIFLSYGHDEYVDLARGLKRDLEALGHEVWFDEDRLIVGADWETRIERGLEWAAGEAGSGRVVLLMTPHSVRRPDGYCLDELARAISRGLSIVPVMVVWAEAPLSICRIQWLDLRDCVPLGSQPAAYERKLTLLTTAIEHDHLDFEGTQARLMSLLDPLPFDAEINEYLQRFTGRDDISEDRRVARRSECRKDILDYRRARNRQDCARRQIGVDPTRSRGRALLPGRTYAEERREEMRFVDCLPAFDPASRI